MNHLAWGSLRPKFLFSHFGRRQPEFAKSQGSFENWVLIGVEEGAFRYELPGQGGIATFGDIVLCPPNVMLGRWMVQHVTHHVIYFTWEHEAPLTAQPEPAIAGGKYTTKDLPRLSSNYSQMQLLHGRDDDGALRLKEHVLTDIILMSLGAFVSESVSNPITDEVMARAAHYLATHLNERISLKAMAASLQLSPVQFTRRFRAAVGTTPNEYLTSLRLQKARALLTETNLTIQEIARHCGYESGHYLSRLFLSEMNLRPGHFRKQHHL